MPVDKKATPDKTENNILNRLVSSRDANSTIPEVLLHNLVRPRGKRTRSLIRWRIPMLGMVDMYINPQSLRMNEKKVISKQRTKGGYVVQYWGEELMKITIDGHTGSGGLDAINVLRSIYRAEQNAFETVSQLLVDKLKVYGGAVAAEGTSLAASSAAGQKNEKLLGSGATPPILPTLASLATSIEMYYQGWVFKGFFEDFSVTESVSDGIGVFKYSMNFTVLDRRGFRGNYMPWHRSPVDFDLGTNPIPGSYRKSDSANSPLSFSGEEVI